MTDFSLAESIYLNVDVLDPSSDTYQPDDLPERETELDRLHQALDPVTMGGTPRNILVYGASGQGKTVAITNKTNQLKRFADENDIDLTVVWVPCEGASGSYQVLGDTIKTVREIQTGPGEGTPTGYSRKVLFNMLVDELQSIGGTIVIVLDEIDAIGDDDYILYELSRASIDGIKLGIIGVTNDLNFRNNLGEAVRSSLGKREVYFNSYDADQLRDILARRAVNALRDTHFEGQESYENLRSDVIEQAAIARCAAHAASETGDARHAIEILSQACDFAKKEGNGKVTDEHVSEAHALIERQAVTEGIASAPIQRQVALLNVVEETINGTEWSETSTLYSRYESATKRHQIDTLAYRTFEEKLGDLKSSGIIAKEFHGRGANQGVTNRYKLNIDVQTVLDQLMGESRIAEYTKEIRSQM